MTKGWNFDMLQFISKNGTMIRKLIVFQIGMILFSLAVSTPLVRNIPMLILADCLAICLHLFLIYTAVWEEGSKDSIRIEQGRMRPMSMKGLYVALIANSLNIFLAIWVMIFRIFVMPGGSGFVAYFTSADVLQQPKWLYNLYSIPRIIVNLLQMMYAGIFKTYMPQNPAVYVLAVILPILTAWVAYILGTKNRKLLGGTVNQK